MASTDRHPHCKSADTHRHNPLRLRRRFIGPLSGRVACLLVFAVMLVWGCFPRAAHKKALLEELTRHPARFASTWSEYSGKDIKDRILPAPDILLDYLLKDNTVQGYPQRPKKPNIDARFFSDILNAVTELPGPVRRHFNKHVTVVFLVEELGGSAYGELLRSAGGEKKGFIVLDVGSLNRKANEWAAWKENSPFTPKGCCRLAAKIEPEATDNRAAAIQFIFLHELGHLVGVAKGAHPDWLAGGDPKTYPFSRMSWLTLEDGFKGESRFDDTFTNRTKLRYYAFAGASLSAKRINETYTQLLNTNFVSLYAATNIFDDFAETYAMYVHVVLQNKPWKISIMEYGKTVREITAPVLDERCHAKKRYVEALFQ